MQVATDCRLSYHQPYWQWYQKTINLYFIGIYLLWSSETKIIKNCYHIKTVFVTPHCESIPPFYIASPLHYSKVVYYTKVGKVVSDWKKLNIYMYTSFLENTTTDRDTKVNWFISTTLLWPNWWHKFIFFQIRLYLHT